MADWTVPLLAAPFAGSFVGVLVRRLPHGRPVVIARSECEACARKLRWAELVPLLSYAVLRGRCRGCRAPIGPFHLALEAAALALAVWVILAEGDGRAALVWADCALAWTLLALASIDWNHRRLPDALTLPLLLAGLGVTWSLEPWHLQSHAIGAASGYVAFRLVAMLYAAWRGREGLGQGDAKLLACAGAWVGWEALDEIVLLGALITIGAALWLGRGRRLSGQTALPFGPGLALSLLIVRLHS